MFLGQEPEARSRNWSRAGRKDRPEDRIPFILMRAF
jgi:hypothetical protein